MPSIYALDDYAVILRRHLARLRKEPGTAMVTDFARVTGVSISHVDNIAVGRRPLTVDLLDGFLRALGLVGEEAVYYSALVRANHAPSAAERLEATEEAVAMRRHHGYPRRPRAPSPGRLKLSVSPQIQASARYAWLLMRGLGLAGITLEPHALARALGGALTALDLKRAPRLYPELNAPPRNRRLAELRATERWTSDALRLALRAAAPLLDQHPPPLRCVTTALWLIRAEDAPELDLALNEAWAEALVQAAPIAARAATGGADTPVRLHQVTVALRPLHTPFSPTVFHENTATNVQNFAIPTAGPARRCPYTPRYPCPTLLPCPAPTTSSPTVTSSWRGWTKNIGARRGTPRRCSRVWRACLPATCATWCTASARW